MHQNDLPQFAALLIVTGEVYNKSIPDYLIDIYWEALQKFNLAEIKEAFKAHIHNPNGGQFFPKPADLIKIISKIEVTTKIAWNKVDYAIKTVGVYRSVQFDDPLIHATIAAIGGWLRICSTLTKDYHWLRHEFQQHYKELTSHPPFETPKYCSGLIEIMNNHSNYNQESPVLINHLSKNVVCVGGKNYCTIVKKQTI